jgi:hypothetical protein
LFSAYLNAAVSSIKIFKMKKTLLSLIAFLIGGTISFSQSKLGEVACVYNTSANLDSTTAVYQLLGFRKVNENSFPSPWAQFSDGSQLIMVRKDNVKYSGLTYYTANLAAIVNQLEKDSIQFSKKPGEGDPIKRYYFNSPDGLPIMLAENLGGFSQPKGISLLSMSPADFKSVEKYPNKQCGVFGEYCHPVKDLEKSIVFWKKLGFTLKSKMDQPYPHAILSDDLMIIGLHQTKNFDYPAITYFGIQTAERVNDLKKAGLTFTSIQGPGNVMTSGWEGQHFFLFSLGM